DGGNVVTTTDPNYEFTAIDVVDDKNQTVSLVVVDSAGARSQAITKEVLIIAKLLPSVTLPRPPQVDINLLSMVVAIMNTDSEVAKARFRVDVAGDALVMECKEGYTAKDTARSAMSTGVSAVAETGEVLALGISSQVPGLSVQSRANTLLGRTTYTFIGGCKKY
ncbi:hypothetical protein IBE10_07830, partial [Francisella tularensis subsp. novicida]